MNWITGMVLVSLAGLVWQAPTRARAQTVDTIRTTLTITSNIDSAWVFIDTVLVGRTPFTSDTLTAGLYRIRVLHPDIEDWLTGGIEDTLFLDAGQHRDVHYELNAAVIIHSVPFGADVLVGDSVVGQTPFLLTLDSVASAETVTLQKAGFEPASVAILNGGRHALSIDLKRLWEKDLVPDPIFKDGGGTKDDNIRLYVAGAATVLSGAAAASFKIRADNRYAMYQKTGDPSLLSETRRLDTAAAVALVATQLGLGLFTYFILSE